MILLRIHTHIDGLPGILGVVAGALLFFLVGYDIALFKKYRRFLKTSGATAMAWWEVALFAVINFIPVWLGIFGVFNAVFDMETSEPKNNLVMALFAGLIFVGLILFFYLKNFKRASARN